MRTVQLLLNLNHPQIAGPLVADGHCGADTIAIIEHFARGVIGSRGPLDLIAPELQPSDVSTTLRALRGGMPSDLQEEKLEAIYIHAAAATVNRFFAALLAGMVQGGIDSPLRQAHFLAQIGHESGELRYTEELASGTAYEGRADLGNTQKGDGVRFKGRGLIQLTGRANYAAFGHAMSQDLVAGDACKRLAAEPALAVGAAVWFWQQHGLNPLADKDDLLAVTKRINGGTNGLEDRRAKLLRAKWFLLPPYPQDAATAGLIRAMQAVAGDEEVWPKTRRHRRKKSTFPHPQRHATSLTL